ncbi:uncharacterized protein PFL1_03919 [Pseudozyma flocculosa PF-1]|uniref:Related to Zn-dependent alcohol dehydrogenases n=2 Tax=Pseudozyma flocculosa TaxID=84751 RepID=A0A5C3EWG4_9BASI|nr:uncharacterized protein PFL1_03919 [Pseudozyma flocculosa PF-1]EPQ28616.1 hypothetical protein PFL1_03919 [Pseudozyma flocculosa PF-1]SPO36558.1 related to Zn-dependent alcohol dehydrogenases [Pseudozyma flocculosa]
MSPKDLPKTMRALVIAQFKADPPYELRDDLPVPQLGPKDVLLKIATAGYCHTEVMVTRGDFASKSRAGLPLIPSHEPTGTIVAFGQEAEAMASEVDGIGNDGPLKLGDRVGCLTFRDFCGKCDDCKAGQPKFCQDQDMVGVTADGACAEYMRADIRSCFRLPAKLSFDAAAPLCCAGATIYTAIKGCSLRAGQRLAIIGAGALGHLGVQMSKCLGLQTILLDARDPPLDMCRKLPYPPDVAYNSGSVDPKNPKQVSKLLEDIGGPVHAVIVATDVIPAFEVALAILRNHGLLMVVGQPENPIPVSYNDLIFRDITVKGSLLGDPALTKEMCDLVADRGIEVKTQAYPLEDVERMRADYAKPGHSGKMVLRVSDGA